MAAGTLSGTLWALVTQWDMHSWCLPLRHSRLTFYFAFLAGAGGECITFQTQYEAPLWPILEERGTWS